MAEVLVGSHGEGFANGSGGYVYTFGGAGTPAGAPDVDDVDALFVNSNTVVSTPSGFTKVVDATDQQGCYWFTRKAVGGEGGTVTITTSGDHNSQVSWQRWSGLDAFSDGDFVRANNSNNTVLPDAATGALAATGMLVVVGAGLHNFDGALAASPVWSDGYTGATSAAQGASGSSSAVVGFTGYKSGVGTASEPVDVVTWTNAARNRYATWIAFTVAAGGATDLTSVDATHAQTAESPALTQDHQLTAADASHGHSAEQPAMTQVHVIAAQDATHAQAADSPTLSQAHALGVADATHGQTADQPNLAQAHSLAPADAIHGHTAAQPALTQVHVLVAGDATHSHLAESPALSQAHVIGVADAAHAQTADQPSLSGEIDLSVNDASHGQTADAATVAHTHLLSPADAMHGHLAESPALTQVHNLVALDARHIHTADQATFPVFAPAARGRLRIRSATGGTGLIVH